MITSEIAGAIILRGDTIDQFKRRLWRNERFINEKKPPVSIPVAWSMGTFAIGRRATIL